MTLKVGTPYYAMFGYEPAYLGVETIALFADGKSEIHYRVIPAEWLPKWMWRFYLKRIATGSEFVAKIDEAQSHLMSFSRCVDEVEVKYRSFDSIAVNVVRSESSIEDGQPKKAKP